jgi:hypothetical protein
VTADDPRADVALDAGLRCEHAPARSSRADVRATPLARRAIDFISSASSSTSCAYRTACAICTLRERELVQAAHIAPTSRPGRRRVVNVSRCAQSITSRSIAISSHDPGGVVHIASGCCEIDGPMLRTSPQASTVAASPCPRRPEDRPGPHRLELRFERFERATA